ncbi:MAG: HAMP domain-containing histidine kinase [Pirellula sp.]|jgi:signal transduction histidine kinase|nr:HAMP domain-containing histidine kinase [Pirellula sp.]
MFERKSFKWPIFLAVIMIVLIVGLTVAWIILNVFGAVTYERPALYWTLLAVGSVMFALVLTGVIVYLVWSIQQIDLNRRQSNFLDAVTHELKSPIASLKLYLQTLNRRSLPDEQRIQFYSSMMEDVERLDRTISQLLEVAKLQQDRSLQDEPEWIRVDEIVDTISKKLCDEHTFDPNHLHLDVPACELNALRSDVEILVRNLLDNAMKYAGTPPEVSIIGTISRDEKELRLVFQDNGNGIPRHLRRAIFKRFYRVGDELERRKPGTGLGLFLVRSFVKRMRGSIQVDDSSKQQGTKFVVQIPNIRIPSSQQPGA